MRKDKKKEVEREREKTEEEYDILKIRVNRIKSMNTRQVHNFHPVNQRFSNVLVGDPKSCILLALATHTSFHFKSLLFPYNTVYIYRAEYIISHSIFSARFIQKAK